MRATEPLARRSEQADRGWRTSGSPSSRPGATAWALAVVVVAALAVGLFLLHG